MTGGNIDAPVHYSSKKSNSTIELIFDTLTPRPHFIIVQNKEHRKSNATEKEIKETMELVKDFLTHKPQYDNNAILSFHRGKWYQQNQKHFHAHLCVPKKPYCHEVKMMVRNQATLFLTAFLLFFISYHQ